MQRHVRLAWSLFALALLAPVVTGSVPRTAAEKWNFKDLDGTRRELLDAKNRATVLFFVAHDCPVANYYAPEMSRICTAYRPKRIAFFAVYVEPDLSLAAAKKHAKDYGYKFPAVLDPTHALVKRTGVKVTPEAAVLSATGKVLYHGRIDDLYLELGKPRYEATTHDLRDALDAILSGKPVAHKTTPAIGCFITP